MGRQYVLADVYRVLLEYQLLQACLGKEIAEVLEQRWHAWNAARKKGFLSGVLCCASLERT